MEKLYASIMYELTYSYKKTEEVILLKQYISDIIKDNKETPEDVFNGFDDIKNIIATFDIKYQWSPDNTEDFLVDQKLNKLYSIFI